VKQIIHGKTYGDKGSGTPVTTLRGNLWSNELGGETSAVFKHSQCWSVAGTFKNLYAQILAPVENSAPIFWTDTTFTLVKIVAGVAVPTTLTVTVPAAGPIAQNGFDAAATDTSHSVTVAPGDVLAIQRSPAETLHGQTNAEYAHVDWSLTFESTNVKESGYGAGSQGSRISGTTAWCAPFNNQQSAFIPVAAPDTIAQTEIHSIVPVAGSIYRFDLQFERAPGAGKSYTFNFVKNGVVQDGSGGTVNTTLVMADTTLVGVATFDLPVVALDLISINCTATSGSPQSTFANIGIGFRATTDGQSALCFNSATGTAIADGSTDWAGSQLSGWAWTTSRSPTPAPSWRPSRWPSTELLVSLPGAIDPFTLEGFCINLGTAPGVGKSYLFTTRKAFTNSAPVVTMTAATDPGSRLNTDPLNGTVAFATVSDRLSIQAVASGTPTSGHVGWAWLMLASTTPAPNLTVIKSHTDPFYQGQGGATFTIVATNTGDADTVGVQTVTDTIPSGLTLVSMAGTGWVCIANVCTRSDVLAPGASYPPITVTVNVGAAATSPQCNIANGVTDCAVIVAPRIGYRYIMKVREEDRVFPVAPERPPNRIMKVSKKRT
jgi:uncharacterized repeat protein (TIGR01451 family)